MLQPAGDRGAGAPRALQDPHRHLAAGHGGGQPPALVPRQQVGPTTQLTPAITAAVRSCIVSFYHLILEHGSGTERIKTMKKTSLNRREPDLRGQLTSAQTWSKAGGQGQGWVHCLRT